MAKYSNVVEYNIITDVDTSGITKLQNELTKLKQSLKFDSGAFNRLGLNSNEIDKSIRKINQLQTALTAAFNPKIGTLDLSKLNASLQKEHVNLQMIVKDWEQMGYRGQAAISSLSNALLSMNKGAVTVNTTLSKIANTFSNTVRWGITASIFQEMMSSVQGAVSYMKDLDESLTNIQMVTNSSKEDMRELAQYANNAAQALGSTTTDYTNAVKVFVQEGFSESESKQYANLSTKLANVSEQSTAVTSDQITAYRNAFQLDYQQTVEAMDKVANVANNTASNVNELMTASQRAASVAQAVGSSQDSFLAAIATIESVTRQSAEEIGNGLKTIYQRFADIKVSGKTDDGVDYGQYAKALQQVGVDVLDVSGQFKGMDQILAELQEVWSGLDDTMKIAVGEKVAGKFQYNRFAALMNNPEYYQKAFAATQNAGGMMDQMNEYYMEGIEGRLNTLQAAGEQVMSTLFDQDTVEPIIEDVTKLVNGLNDMVEAAGGLTGVVQALGAIMLRTFSTQIAGTISNIANSISMVVANSRNANQLSTSIELLGLKNLNQSTLENSKAAKLVNNVAPNYDSLSEKTREKIRDLSQQIVQLEDERVKLLQEQEQVVGEIQARALGEKEIIDAKLKSQGTLYAERKKELELQLQTGKITKEQYNNEIGTIRASLQDLGTKRNLYRQIEKAVTDYNKKIAEGKTLEEQDVQELLKMKEAARGLGIDVEKLDKILQDMGINIQNLNLADKVVGDTAKMVAFEAKVNNIVKTLSSITSIAFGFSMIGDMFKTLSDETATFEDKLNAVIMNGTMGVTMLLPGLASLAKSLTLLRNKWIEENIAKVISMKTDSVLLINLKATIAALWAKIKALATATVKLIENAAAQFMALPLPAKIAIGVAALTVALVAATKAWIDNYSEVAQATREYEKQSEILIETKRNYQNVAESLETLKGSLDKVSDLRSSLEDMKEGTDEWKEAVRKLNQEVFTLIQTYPEIAKFVTNEKGVLTINNDQGQMDKFYQEQIDKVNHLNDINSIQQIDTLNAKNNQLIAQYAEKNNISSDEIRKALAQATEEDVENGEVKIVGHEDLTKSFSELAASIQSNNASIKMLTETVGTLDNSYTNYAKNIEISDQKALNSLFNRIGGGTDYGERYKDTKLLDAISELLGEDIISSEDTGGIIGDSLKITTKSGEVIEHSSAIWQQLLMDNEKTLLLVNEKLEENKKIYEALGSKWNEKTQSFEGGFQLNKQQEQLIKDYQNNTEVKTDKGIVGFADYINSLDNGIKSVEDFAKALADTNGELFKFTEELGNIQGATSLGDLEYEYAKTDKTSTDTEDYNNKLDELTQAASEAYEIDLDDIIDQAKAFREELELTEGAARELAIQNQRMTKGIDALHDNWEKWSDVLQNSNHMAKDYIDTTQDVTKAIANLVGAGDDLDLSNEFFESAQNLEDIALAADGDIEAINRLGVAVGKDLVEAMEAVSREASGLDFSDADTEQAYTNMVNQFYDAKSTVMAGLDELQAQINNLGIGENVYDILGGQDWVNALNLMAEQTQMSVEEMNSLLNSIGVQADVTVKDVDTTVDVPKYKVTEEVRMIKPPNLLTGELGAYEKTTSTQYLGSDKMPGKIPVAQINTGDAMGTPPSITYVGNGPVSRSSTPAGRSKGGGGGKSPKSSTPKETKPKNNKPKDNAKNEWDYLTDITNDLDRQAAIIEKLSKLEDRLYGANRISQLRKLQKEYQKNIDLLKQEVELAQKHAEKLRTNAYDENGNLTINGYAYRAGFNQIQFDSTGNLENGKAIEEALTNRINAAVAEYNIHRNDEDTSYYEDQISLAEKDRDGFMKAMSEYESTLGTIEDGQSQIQEYQEKIQDAADSIVDSIQEGIENVVEAIDSQRDFNKMYRDWMEGGSSYSHFNNNRKYYTEGLSGLLSPTIGNRSIFETQVQNLQNRIKDVENIFDNDSSDTDKEKLSEAAAQENLQEATENVLNTLKTVVEYYDSLLETINEASEKMDELIDDRLQAYDNIENFLDTRLEQIKLLFGEDYGAQVRLYNQKIDTNMSKIVSINDAIEAKQVTVKTLESLEESGKKLSTEEREELRNARDKVNELQEKQLTTETELLQDIASKLTAQTNAEMDKMVNNMFGGNDVEWIAQQWEIATRNSTQYLDDYNRAFELQKLQLQYQDLLNNAQETTLNIQQRISNHMNEQLGYLRDKKNLSEYDVKYAQTQLDILQKQIALEEARNNKSQMRLQRNAAGNYDFVYGADEAAVTKATEALLAAQQEAYNLSKQIYLDTYNSAVEAALKTKQMVVEIATDASLDIDEKTERIKYILDNLKEYMDNSSVELNDISINLYNDFIEAENLIAQENLGNLSDIFNELRAQSTETKNSMTKDMEDYWDKDENSAKNTWERTGAKATETFNGIQEGSKLVWTRIGESTNIGLRGIETDWNVHGSNVKGTLEKIKQGSDASYSGIKDKIGLVLDSIDTRFVLTQDKSISGTEKINEVTKDAFENMKVHLEDYGNDTEEVLESAGDSYNTFVQDSLNYAAEETENLDETTNNFKYDLEYLNDEIHDCSEEMKKWGNEVETAMNKAAEFVQKGNNLQQWLGGNAVLASMAADSFESLADASSNVADSISTMAHEIEDSYWSLQNAASIAADAYRDMAGAAREAEYAANDATRAINNIPQRPDVGITSNFSEVAGALLGGVGSAVSSMRNALHGLNSGSNNWLWDGFTYSRWDTGGYTGTWFDKGMDSKDGKLAILHKKELVLNADDTENMLSAVELVRDIISNINTIPSLGKISNQNSLGNNVEQRVEISATFPGVTTALEIERALTELADNAYQYSNRYKY